MSSHAWRVKLRRDLPCRSHRPVHHSRQSSGTSAPHYRCCSIPAHPHGRTRAAGPSSPCRLLYYRCYLGNVRLTRLIRCPGLPLRDHAHVQTAAAAIAAAPAAPPPGVIVAVPHVAEIARSNTHSHTAPRCLHLLAAPRMMFPGMMVRCMTAPMLAATTAPKSSSLLTTRPHTTAASTAL